MKKIIYLLCLVSFSLTAQVQQISEVNVGAYVDHTIVPLSPQSNFSHSQTIYYSDQLQFRGYISSISYFTPFSNYTTTDVPVDPANLTIKLGMTTIEEFDASTSFVPDTELTQMTGILRSTSVYEIRYTFETPFYYDGTQNLVVDVEDLNPGASSSATDGYRGVENFGNPPTRSIISLTTLFDDGSSSSSLLKQNAYPQTLFAGNLERCYWVSVTSHSDVQSTTATAELSASDDVTTIRYNVIESGEEIPETYNTTTERVLQLTNLLPAQKYYTHVKSDCDEIPSSYRSYPFTTRPLLLTPPHTIDFEGGFNRDYTTVPEIPYGVEVSAEAANNSSFGIEMYGRTYPSWSSWLDYGNPFEVNDDYIRTVSLDIDLTNAINPVFQFDLKQPSFGTYYRVKVNEFGQDNVLQGQQQGFVYQPISGANNDEFKKVVVDLTDFVGQTITLKLEHVSKSYTRLTYLDNLELKENDCLFNPEINSSSTENSIAIDWNSSETDHELLITPYNEFPTEENTLETNLNHTFSGLALASSYETYLRSLCVNGPSPYVKKHVTTKTTPLEIPYYSTLNNSTINSDFFVVQYQDGASNSFPNGGNIVLHQQNCNSQWVGGETTTESQAWNDNEDFITGLKYRVDATSVLDANMLIRFKQYHYYNSNPTHSWFRVLINGTQVGPSYNPQTKNGDPVTDFNIDLTPYIGEMIDVELQQVGRSISFEGGGISGDGTLIILLDVSGTLSTEEQSLTNRINIYPNPTQNQITIESQVVIDEINIIDINGRILNAIKLDEIAQNYQLDVSNLSNGIYFIEINSGKAKHIQKFIKK